MSGALIRCQYDALWRSKIQEGKENESNKTKANEFSHLRAFWLLREPDMKTDKSQFDEVLRRMLEKPPQKTAEIHAKKEPKKAPKARQST